MDNAELSKTYFPFRCALQGPAVKSTLSIRTGDNMD